MAKAKKQERVSAAKKKKAAEIAAILESLYPDIPIPLEHHDPYTLLIAVVLSAQCTDVRVNQVTPHLFAAAATPQDMVKLTAADIEQIIRPCGLAPRKSKAIRGLSEILLENTRALSLRISRPLSHCPGWAIRRRRW